MSIAITTSGGTLATTLTGLGPKNVGRLTTVVHEAAADVRDGWRANAQETSGWHGWRYPSTIRSYREGPLSARVEPREWMRQGGMSFEFGSRNQPPHLDGQRALDTLAPRLIRRFESALIF